jgi:hypothetical protein
MTNTKRSWSYVFCDEREPICDYIPPDIMNLDTILEKIVDEES